MTLKSSTRDERPLKIREKTNKQMRGESESPASKSVQLATSKEHSGQRGSLVCDA